MSKFSSFKDQQTLTESWRTYNNILEEQGEPVKPNTFKTNNQEKPEEIQKPEEIEKPEQKDLKAFQNRQTQISHFTPQVISQKIIQFLQTLKGFDLQKNNAVVLNSLRMLTKEFTDASSNQTKQATPQQPVNKQAIKQGSRAGTSPQQQPVKQALEESIYDDARLDDGTLVCPECLQELIENDTGILQEAKYQGKTVTLNKPMKGDVKKSKVYVKNEKGNVVKVNFGDKNMTIKKNIPARRKSFRARHKCESPGPKTKARYWSCKAW
jgi:hypothetical protein